MSRQIKQIRHFIVFLLLTASLQAANNAYIIANSEVPVDSVTKEEISHIFLGNRQFWSNDSRIKTAYVAHKGEEMNTVFNDYLNTSYKKFKRYWLKKIFSGYGTAPKSLKNAKSVLEFVAQHDGAIALYIGSKPVEHKDIKILTVNDNKAVE